MELKTYELEVEVKVRRTMRVKAPNPEAAKAVAWAFLSLTAEGRGELSSALKWTDGRTAYRPMPVETILPLDPETVFTENEPVEVAGE
jgi:hypothetical protein